VRGIKETGGSPEEFYIVAIKRRLCTKQIQRELSVDALRFQAKRIGRGKLCKLVRRKGGPSDSSPDRFQQLWVPARVHKSLGNPHKIMLEHDRKLWAIFEGSDHLAIHLRKNLGKGLCLT
jgi:hypothetical protein